MSGQPLVTLTPELLLRAYAVGVFPMAESANSQTIYWFDPEMRGIIPLDRPRIGRRLRRTVKQQRFHVTTDTAFDRVIRACAEPAPDRPNTWINADVIRAYSALAEGGFAHSVECWLGDELAGGLYGVALGGAFFGESMFSRVTDASKVALVHLIARLRHGGFTLLDTQFVTRHLAQFGATEVPRAEYREMLADALEGEARFYSASDDEALERLWQSISQTS